MNNLKKVGLTALGTALVSTASVAGDMSVTGSAIITFTGNDNSNKGNGWTMSDTISFS
jgi:outer membrane protein OmpU